ncbi:hypothetical protein [Alkalibacter mobilis]|uniref:hypothetical protein n=1 Tax=Alkalibacter mobilis TaxID=2787712 RepID=UPI0018A04405|nr:hypothetical protein [Alkalibacter mobilis]MBF7096259.1 hypothetical protein [Alkalibacter mobilis]
MSDRRLEKIIKKIDPHHYGIYMGKEYGYVLEVNYYDKVDLTMETREKDYVLEKITRKGVILEKIFFDRQNILKLNLNEIKMKVRKKNPW